MTDNIEESVLMKCSACGYEEPVPLWVLDEFNNDRSKGYVMACPCCDKKMVEKSIRNILAK